MSIAEVRKCDGVGCTASTGDYMAAGWIVIGDGGFTKYAGRGKTGTAIAEVYVREGADFCGWTCLKSKKGRKP